MTTKIKRRRERVEKFLSASFIPNLLSPLVNHILALLSRGGGNGAS